MKILTLMFAMLIGGVVQAQIAPIQEFCSVGGVKVVTQGTSSTTTVMGSYPKCTVTVYLTGTLTKATLFADNISTPLANPFTATTSGAFLFYAATMTGYDVVVSGGTPLAIPAPFTYVDVFAGGSSGGGGTGSVTSVTIDGLPPFFTTSVTNPTTQPHASFTATPAGQNTFLAGPATGGTGAYSFRAILPVDLPAGSSSGLGALQCGSGTTCTAGVISAAGATGPISAKAVATDGAGAFIAATVAGTGTGLTTGPITSTINDVVSFSDAVGTIKDSGISTSDLGRLGTAQTYTALDTFSGGLNTTTAGITTGNITTANITNLNVTSSVNFSLPSSSPTFSFLMSSTGASFVATSSSRSLQLGNATNATSSLNQSSPSFNLQGNYWNGSATSVDSWNFQDSLGSGTNPTSTLSIIHNGTTGLSQLNIGSALTLGTSLQVGATKVLTSFVDYQPSLTPAPVAANSCADQSFTVTGLTTLDNVTTLRPPSSFGNVSADPLPAGANLLVIHFCNPSIVAVTPPAGTYEFLAIR